MADFRKLFYALAIVALVACFTVPAAAQTLLCTSTTATNQIIRHEGYAELAGDIVLSCSGTGGSTAPGQPIAAADITVTVPQTSITSKIINPGSTYAISEATLIMDDLKDPSISAVGNYPGVRTHRLCNDTVNGSPGVCTVLAPASPNVSYLGDAGHPNIFIGTPSGANAVVFHSVPLDPPGTGFNRTIRITNIRIDGTQIAVSALAQVVAIVFFQGPASVAVNSIQATIGTVQTGLGATKVTADNTFLQCEYPLDTLTKGDVAAVENHGYCTTSASPYSGSSPGVNTGFSINSTTACNSSNYTGLSGTAPVFGAAFTGQMQIDVTEGFQTAFKPRNMSELLGSGGVVVCGANNGAPCNGGGGDNNDTSSATYTTYNGTTTFNPFDIAMNNPQVRFFTEGGFTESSATLALTNGAATPGGGVASVIPYADPVAGSGTFPNGATGGGAGTADYGTRLQFTISSIPSGTVLSLPTVVNLFNGTTKSGVMVMITPSNTIGYGAFTATAASSALTSLQDSGYFDLTGPTATVTYEVLFSDPGSTETAKIFPVVYYPASSLPTSVLSDMPQANVGAQVTPATFAPYYTTGGNQVSSPLGQLEGTPRFTQSTGTTSTLFTISRCTCSLLFPWVVSDNNYVTGIVVANTSKDPTNGLTPPVIGYTATQTSGKVNLYLFGTIGGKTAQTNTSIAAVYPGTDTQALSGSYATFIVNTGFDGYAITQANFQYCHGLAFLFNATGAVPPVSYLGLTLDKGAALPRTVQPFQDGLVE